MENKITNEDLLLEYGYEDIILFKDPSFEGALVGVTTDNRAVYDIDLMIASMLEEDESLSYNDAIEFIEYNTIRSLPYYENSPIIFSPIER